MRSCSPKRAPAALELRGIHAGYGETPVLREISLSVAPGGRLAILGANGAGKTTLLKIVSGLLAPSAGSVLLDGRDVTRLSPARRTGLGLCHIPDPRGIFPSLTVEENLVLQSPKGRAAEGVALAVDTFPRLGERLGQQAGTLSGGEQQMLAVARAYVQNPRVVLLDEVSMGLAPNVAEEIFGYLEQLSVRGAALVIVEQFVHRALAMVGQVVVLSRGRVVLAGEAGALPESSIFEAYAGSPTGDDACARS
jgi:branched-chain amino acid transport system ATP-binding protein